MPHSTVMAVGLLSVIAFFLYLLPASRLGRKWVLIGAALLLLVSLSLAGYQLCVWRSCCAKERSLAAFESKLKTLHWAAYEPRSLNPRARIFAQRYGTERQIRTELTALRKAGFQGLITFGADGLCGRIPRIAKSLDPPFEGVVMGVTRIDDPAEVMNAIRARRWVDAYCVGQMFTEWGFATDDLLACIHRIARETARPVSTTLTTNGYVAYPRVAEACDWLCPDVHVDWYYDADAERAFDHTKQLIESAGRFRLGTCPDKPVLLKMISLPWREARGSSQAEQALFYQMMSRYHSSPDWPARVYPSFFSVYDISWKRPEEGWPPGERFLGLLKDDGTPRQAAKYCVVRRTETIRH